MENNKDSKVDLVGKEGTSFKKELESLINSYSVENESDTPDYILTEYLRGCLAIFASAVRLRDMFFEFKPWKELDVEEDGIKQREEGVSDSGKEIKN